MMALTNTLDVLGAGTWTIVPDQSSVHFWVRNFLVRKVRGKFETFSGTIAVGPYSVPAVAARIDITSVNTGNEKRDRHLQAPEFFDTEQYSEAAFTSTSVLPVGEAYQLDGDLTIKGVTKPVRLQLEFNGIDADRRYGHVSHYVASITVDRKDFGIDFKLPLGLGNIIVGPKVTVTLDIEAVKNN
jgi:polyisoprenoid-binding protein YceI